MKVFSWVFMTLFLACSSGNDNKGVYAVAEESMVNDMEDIALNTPPPPVPQEETGPRQEVEQKIIKTGNLRFETPDLAATQKKIMEAVDSSRGYLQDDQSGKNYGQIYHRMQVRVPTANFQQLLDAVSRGVEYFDEKTISRQDVTEEFVDITARLKAKRELENRYLSLLKQAKNVKEILEIEAELSKIREEIEAREGRLKYLQSQVSYSTLHIYFYKNVAETGATVSYGSKLGNAFKGGWNGLSTFILGLVYLWPFIILLILAIFLLRTWRKRHKAKATKNNTP
ncbi:MAG: hypothetical protein CL868_06825 [Cytophagaceae bacterium]|nr:hypothetical protein [Cytophagaceae bacterium]|tara:strand:- start:41806 stop:42657 length:852 start_codon:yes stop_codon:yes gene_type:complete